jgi:uncharacterized protein YifE (UPF0438 family)
MNYHECFKVNAKFQDKINFPYGFLKSGEFTIDQARLLERNGVAYSELASEARRPVGEIEREFVDFCRGKKSATTLHERTWQRYICVVEKNRLAISFNKRRHNSLVDLDEFG